MLISLATLFDVQQSYDFPTLRMSTLTGFYN